MFEIEVENCNHPCESFVAEEFELISVSNCDDLADLCLETPLDQTLFYDIVDNGEAYLNGLDGCLNDTIFAYSYFTIPGM